MPMFLRRTACAAVLALASIAGGCASSGSPVPSSALEPDRLLFERGTAALNARRWFTAREYFRQIVEGYPQSQYRGEAKLGLGDTYLGENTAQSQVLAANEFREFLTFFPTHPRADYAQFRLAMSYHSQMARAERDQTNTREALKEFEAFFERFPTSALAGEARVRQREARDRLSESEYKVGLFYYRTRWYPGAIDRLQSVLKVDPDFTNRDAVYYYLAESLAAVRREAEALPLLDRLVREFEASEFLERAQKRIPELKASMTTTPPPTDKPGS